MCYSSSSSPKPKRQEDVDVTHRGWIHRKVLFLCMLPIYFYRRYVSPLTPPSCRFVPTCSQYALDAYHVHGVFRGTWLTFTRILRCHPWHPGGNDPVVPYEQKK